MFKITKDLSPDKVTGYTYQDMPIVLSKRRGRPPRTRAKPTWHPLDKKIHAACIYAVTGSLDKAAELSDIPKNQLKSMMNEQWWDDAIKQVRREENDTITAKMTLVVDQSLDAMLDRLQNGDHYLVKEKVVEEDGSVSYTDKLVRVPVKMKDLTMPAGILTDKRQLLRGEATSRSEKIGQDDILKELGQKFENFAKQLGQKTPQTIDVTDAEVITDGNQENEVREVQEGQGTKGNG